MAVSLAAPATSNQALLATPHTHLHCHTHLETIRSNTACLVPSFTHTHVDTHLHTRLPPLPPLTSSCAASVSRRLLSLVTSLLRASTSAWRVDRLADWASREAARPAASDCCRLRALLPWVRRAAAMSRDTAQRYIAVGGWLVVVGGVM